MTAPFQMLLAASGVVLLTLLDHDFTGNVSGSSHDFTMDCGAGGDLVFGAQIFTNGNWGTVTIGGVTATQVVGASLAGGNRSAIYVASGVPAGNQTVHLAVSGGSGLSTRWAVQLYSIRGHASLTPYTNATDTAHTTGTQSATLNIVAGAAALGVAFEVSGSATGASASGLTLDVADVPGGGTNTVYASASANALVTNSSYAVSISFTGGTTQIAAGAFAVWSPA